MTFNDNAKIDTGQVGGGGRRRGGLVLGGGAGGLVLTVLFVLFQMYGGGGGGTGAGPWAYDPGQVQGGGGGQEQDFSHCQTGADANAHIDCRIIGTVNSVQDYWEQAHPQYQDAKTIIFTGSVSTGCGAADSSIGPFYCPADSQVYLDTGFFEQLSSELGANDAPLTQMYVVAHEYGHHIQNLDGTLGKAQEDPKGPKSGAVRLELQADCYAGVWVHHASTTEDDEGNTLIKPVTDAQVADALSAASAVGDDRIQEKAQGRVTPENWTHGSSEQRQHWFSVGQKSGDPARCDTFHAGDL